MVPPARVENARGVLPRGLLVAVARETRSRHAGRRRRSAAARGAAEPAPSVVVVGWWASCVPVGVCFAAQERGCVCGFPNPVPTPRDALFPHLLAQEKWCGRVPACLTSAPTPRASPLSPAPPGSRADPLFLRSARLPSDLSGGRLPVQD